MAQGLVHGPAVQFPFVEPPAFGSDGSVGPLDDVVELRSSWRKHLGRQASLGALGLQLAHELGAAVDLEGLLALATSEVARENALARWRRVLGRTARNSLKTSPLMLRAMWSIWMPWRLSSLGIASPLQAHFSLDKTVTTALQLYVVSFPLGQVGVALRPQLMSFWSKLGRDLTPLGPIS